jgi:hypothetical protein
MPPGGGGRQGRSAEGDTVRAVEVLMWDSIKDCLSERAWPRTTAKGHAKLLSSAG